MRNPRIVGIISGLTFTGKSFTMKKLLRLPQFRNTAVIEMEEIRKRYWGDKYTYESLKNFRNELTRIEIKRLLLIEERDMVLAEIPMLTDIYHQRPMVSMLHDASLCIAGVQKDKERRGEKFEADVDIELRAVLLFASIEAVETRVSYRESDPSDLSDVRSIKQYAWIAEQYQLPLAYTPLYVDTSDETKTEENFNKIVNFLETGEYDAEENNRLKILAEQYLNKACEMEEKLPV
jgi:hypothetical protein